jgi:hypothetical protein
LAAAVEEVAAGCACSDAAMRRTRGRRRAERVLMIWEQRVEMQNARAT